MRRTVSDETEVQPETEVQDMGKNAQRWLEQAANWGFEIAGDIDVGLRGRFAHLGQALCGGPLYLNCDLARLYVSEVYENSWILDQPGRASQYLVIPMAGDGCVPAGYGPIECRSYSCATDKPSWPPNTTLTIKYVNKAEIVDRLRMSIADRAAKPGPGRAGYPGKFLLQNRMIITKYCSLQGR